MRKVTLAAFAVLALVGLLFGSPSLALASSMAKSTVQAPGGKDKPDGKKNGHKKHGKKKHGKKHGKKKHGKKHGKKKHGNRGHRGHRGNR